MKSYKPIVLLLAGLVFLEFVLPAISRWNGLILPVLYQNCGAVPDFIQQIVRVEEAPSELGLRRTITCGISGIIFLLAPGILRFLSWTYRFLRR